MLVGATFFAVGSALFCWLFLRGRLIPAALAWLGVLASVLLVVALPMRLAGTLPDSFWIWLPMLVFEVTLAFWLLIKGVTADRSPQLLHPIPAHIPKMSLRLQGCVGKTPGNAEFRRLSLRIRGTQVALRSHMDEARYERLCRIGLAFVSAMHWVVGGLLVWSDHTHSSWTYSPHVIQRLAEIAAHHLPHL